MMYKRLFAYLKRYFSWHLYPSDKDLGIKSVVEILFYLVVMLILVLVFYYWHKVPERNIVVYMDQIAKRDSIPSDSAQFITADILFGLPMSNKEFDNIEKPKISFIFEEKVVNRNYKDSLRRIFYVDSNRDSDIKPINELLTKSTTDSAKTLFDDFYSKCPAIRGKSIIYYSLAHTRGPNSVPAPTYNKIDSTNVEYYYSKGAIHWNYTVLRGFTAIDTVNFIAPIRISDVFGKNWYRLEDISQSYYNVAIRTSTIDSITLCFDFKGVSEFSRMIPEPDEIGMSSIRFYDQEKIKRIKRDGLKFHVNHTELTNMQTIRLLGITTILGGIIVLFVAILFVGLYHYFAWWRKEKLCASIIILAVILLILFVTGVLESYRHVIQYWLTE